MPIVDSLCKHPEFADTAASYIWTEWQQDFKELTKYKTQAALANFLKSLNDKDIPTAFIIFENDVLIGLCVVDLEDMGVHPHLSPWLASVIIHPSYRNRGYCIQLLEYVIPKYDSLYLWTFNDDLARLYTKFGFTQIDVVQQHGQHSNIIVMHYLRRHIQ